MDVGSLSDFSGSGTTYTVDITAPTTGSGDITLTIAEDAVSVDNAEADYTIAYSALPTVTVVFDPTNFRNGQTSEATITWSESVSGFGLSDLSVDVGSVSNFSGSGTTYTADITAPSSGSGDVTLTIATDAVVVGNAEATAAIAYTAAPTVTISSDDSDIRVNEEFTVTFEWSETVTGFATGVVTVTGATKGTFSATDGDTYTLGLTADSSAGDIVVTVDADAVSEGNAETAETFTSSALPTATVTFSPTSLQLNATATATITWSEAVSGFALADISVDVGSLASFATTSTTVYTVEVTAPGSGAGDITLTIAEDAVTLGNAEADYTIAYAADPDAITIEAIDEIFITVGTTNYELEIDVTGDPTDFEIDGNWQGFYYDWDGDNNRLYIKSNSVNRLVADAEWTLNLSKTGQSASATIIYNVIPAAPVIDDPGDLTFFRGVRHNRFIQVDNDPAELRVGGDLVGLTHAPGVNDAGNTGVFITGNIDKDSDFAKTDFQFTIDTANDAGDDTLDVDFSVVDTPNMWLSGAYLPNFPSSSGAVYQVFRAWQDTPNNAEAAVYQTNFTEYNENIANPLITGMVVSGNTVRACYKQHRDTNSQRFITGTFFAGQITVTSDIEITDFRQPEGLTRGVDPFFGDSNRWWTISGHDRKLYSFRAESSGLIFDSVSNGAIPANLTKPRGIAYDADANDAYIVDFATRRVNVFNEVNGTNTLFHSTPAVQRYFNLPTGCDTPGDIFINGNHCYVVATGDTDDSGTIDSSETWTTTIYQMNKNTANATTATATRTFTLPEQYVYSQAIFIDS